MKGNFHPAKFTAIALVLSSLSIQAQAATPVIQQAGTGVTINQTATNTTVTQAGAKATNLWHNINTANGETLQFVMPTAGAVSINKVTNGQATQFKGLLKSNVGTAGGATGGRIVLQNEAGITFSAGSQVNVGALIATTAKNVEDMSSGDNAMRFKFSDAKNSVVNNGDIKAGTVALVAPIVTNGGSIKTTPGGRIDLAATDKFMVHMYGGSGNPFISYEASGKTLAAATLTNTGTLEAKGGWVNLKADGAKTIAQNVINLSGVVDVSGAAISHTYDVYSYPNNNKDSRVFIGQETYTYAQSGGLNVTSAGNVNLKNATIHADSVNTDTTALRSQSGPVPGTVSQQPWANGGSVTIKAANGYSDTADTIITADRLGATGEGGGGNINITSKSAKLNGQYSASSISHTANGAAQLAPRNAGYIDLDTGITTIGKTMNATATNSLYPDTNKNIYLTRNVLTKRNGLPSIYVKRHMALAEIKNGKGIK